VGDNVGYGLILMKVAEKAELARRVAESLKWCACPIWHKRKPAQLSGGQRQRIAPARALIKLTARRCSCWTSRSSRSPQAAAIKCDRTQDDSGAGGHHLPASSRMTRKKP